MRKINEKLGVDVCNIDDYDNLNGASGQTCHRQQVLTSFFLRGAKAQRRGLDSRDTQSREITKERTSIVRDNLAYRSDSSESSQRSFVSFGDRNSNVVHTVQKAEARNQKSQPQRPPPTSDNDDVLLLLLRQR